MTKRINTAFIIALAIWPIGLLITGWLMRELSFINLGIIGFIFIASAIGIRALWEMRLEEKRYEDEILYRDMSTVEMKRHFNRVNLN